MPEGWEIVQLNEICSVITDGTHQTPAYSKEGYIFLSSKNVTSGKIDWKNIMHIPEELHNELYARLSPEFGDILLAKNGTTGCAAVVDRDCVFDIYVSLALLRTFKNEILPEYLRHTISSQSVQEHFKGHLKGIGVPNLHLEDIRTAPIPLPPLSEQHRIAAAIESAFTLIDEIERSKTDLQTAVAAAKSKILSLAIRGKLVPQDPADEPAGVLLERIRAERENLVKAGKIKRGKSDPAIIRGDDNPYYKNVPFDVPEGWVWCRLGDMCEIARGGSPRPIQDYITTDDNGVNWIKIGDTEQGGKYITNASEKIKPEGVSHSRFVHAGDFLLTNSMSFGRPYILKIDGCIHDGWLVIGEVERIFVPDYLYHLLSSDWAYRSLSMVAYGSTVKNLKSDTVKAIFLPLPPLAEQQRIVIAIETAFEQLNNIVESLN